MIIIKRSILKLSNNFFPNFYILSLVAKNLYSQGKHIKMTPKTETPKNECKKHVVPNKPK